MMSSMPLIISQDENPPRDNLDEGKLVLLWKEGQQGKIDKQPLEGQCSLEGW
jgi:hypothetical protein